MNLPILASSHFAILLLGTFSLRAQTIPQPPSANLVLLGGRIWTGDTSHPYAEAVAIQGDRFVATGSTSAMLKLATPGARIIQLQDRLVLLGFNDAHVHVQVGGANLVGVHLTDTTSTTQFRQRIAAFAGNAPKGSWILQGLWDEQRWIPIALPTHQLIDDITPNNPVAVSRTDLHIILANALAMKLAGVNRDTKDIPGGIIMRDAEGNPTGIFKDAAVPLITSAIPPNSEQDMERYFLAAQQVAAQNGVTSIQDMAGSAGDPEVPLKLRALESLAHQGKLKVRVAECFGLADGNKMKSLGIRANFGNDMFHIGCLKSFADGGLGASTAWFTAPYTDNPSNSGIASDTMQHPEQMYSDIKPACKSSLTQSAIGPITPSWTSTKGLQTMMARATGAIGSNTPRPCFLKIFPASQSCMLLHRSSRSTPSTMGDGPRSDLVPFASRPPTLSAPSWIRAQSLRSVPTGRSHLFLPSLASMPL